MIDLLGAQWDSSPRLSDYVGYEPVGPHPTEQKKGRS